MPTNLVVTLIVVAVLYGFNMWTFTDAAYRNRKAYLTFIVLVVLVVWLLFGLPPEWPR